MSEKQTSRRAIGNAALAGGAVVFLAAVGFAVVRSDNAQTAAHSEFQYGAGAPLADVDTMIAQLEFRLRGNPSDVEGWRMLGWSKLQTGYPEEAIAAYERASSLAPNEAAIWASLGEAQLAAGHREKARTSLNKAMKFDSNDPSVGDLRAALNSNVRSAAIPGPTSEQMTAAANLPADEQQSMAIGMVDRLAARLKTNPRDLEGWKRLMRARMVLEQPAAATEALRSGLAAFRHDPAVQSELRAAARDLNVSG